MSQSEIIECFIKSWLDFDLSVRSGNYFNENDLEKILKSLDQVDECFALSNSIPKTLAGVFAEIYMALESSSIQYTGDKREEIIHATDLIMDKIRKICEV